MFYGWKCFVEILCGVHMFSSPSLVIIIISLLTVVCYYTVVLVYIVSLD